MNNYNPKMQELANLINYAKTFETPQAFMQELQRQNPQMANYMMELSRNIKNPMQVAIQRLSEQGIDPQTFLSMIGK